MRDDGLTFVGAWGRADVSRLREVRNPRGLWYSPCVLCSLWSGAGAVTPTVIRSLILVGLVAGVSACSGEPQSAPPGRETVVAVATGLDKFDPARDPAADLRAAVAEATRTGRRIILDVGGEWCSWCHILDRYVAAHVEVKSRIDRGYVWLKINFSDDNKNEAFLSKYPKISGYPHLFVLESDGTLLHSQDTALLEEGPSYNLQKVLEFLDKWTRR
jgi:thiol:disulfide interchange protein